MAAVESPQRARREGSPRRMPREQSGCLGNVQGIIPTKLVTRRRGRTAPARWTVAETTEGVPVADAVRAVRRKSRRKTTGCSANTTPGPAARLRRPGSPSSPAPSVAILIGCSKRAPGASAPSRRSTSGSSSSRRARENQRRSSRSRSGCSVPSAMVLVGRDEEIRVRGPVTRMLSLLLEAACKATANASGTQCFPGLADRKNG